MCARFYIDSDSKELQEIGEQMRRSPLSDKLLRTGSPVLTSGEIRPTNIVPVIAPNRNRTPAAFPMKWGIQIPGGPLIINARVETASKKPTFREAWERHRCIIPASWYYEWTHTRNRSGREVPGDKYKIQPLGSAIAWLTGLYTIEDGLPYFTVLTREATKELAFIHNRMPLLLPEDRIRDWIAPEIRPEASLPYALTDLISQRVQ